MEGKILGALEVLPVQTVERLFLCCFPTGRPLIYSLFNFHFSYVLFYVLQVKYNNMFIRCFSPTFSTRWRQPFNQTSHLNHLPSSFVCIASFHFKFHSFVSSRRLALKPLARDLVLTVFHGNQRDNAGTHSAKKEEQWGFEPPTSWAPG